ncbi:hypothetical protein HAX54_039479 [Datura stramonium]|uniref:Peptidase S8/S53 domain-containing protein n=1 Tax=Datura stramonium TaxID=4076 RepID=A0ABS8SJC7_DATST|nr:hypothetical protein [Datura stramonium]
MDFNSYNSDMGCFPFLTLACNFSGFACFPAGVPPPLTKWKGKCEFNFTTACNNKLIGARYFQEFGNGTPLDENGHGTHVSSTAARNFINGANVFGLANGTVSGVAPLAHVAMYKVRDASVACSESDTFAAMDVAIEDGVDDESEIDQHAQEHVASPVSTIEQSVDSLTGGKLNMEAAIEIDTPIATATKMDLDETGSSIELRSRLCFHEIDLIVDIIEGTGARSLSSSKRGNLLGSM